LETLVGTQSGEVVDVVAFFIKARVEADEGRLAGLKPLCGATAGVVTESGFGLQAMLTKLRVTTRR